MHYLEVYTDISLKVTMLLTVLIYSAGLARFLKPFAVKKNTVYLSAVSYAVIMLISLFIPEDFHNLISYAAATSGAFLIFTIRERRNYGEKLFLAFSFFSVRWFTGAVNTIIWLNFFNRTYAAVLGRFAENETAMLAVNIVYDVIESSIMLIVMFCMIRVFHRVYAGYKGKMSFKECFILILPSVSGVFTYCILLYFKSIDVSTLNVNPYGLFSLLYYILSYAVMIVVIWFYGQIKKVQQMEKERAMLAVQTNNIGDYISGAENLYHDIRAIRHDMRNHLAVLENLYEKGERKAFENYLEDAKERISVGNELVTGNPVTDVIINEKRSEAERKGIRCEFNFHYPSAFTGKAIDMSIILNNALNNAIEAAEKCPENERFITISSVQKKKAFIITVTNSCTPTEIINGEIPATTKSDSSNHGFGLLNIKNNAEKYSGGIDIECSEGKFLLTVMLMLN
jgi:sensor histidine kinase YesM